MYSGASAAKPSGQSMAGKIDLNELIKPNWNQAKSYNRFGSKVVETPLDSTVKLMFSRGAVNGTFDFRKSYSRSSFLIINGAGGFKAYIMTLIADPSYLNNDFNKLQLNAYNKRDKNYSGFCWILRRKAGRLAAGIILTASLTRRLIKGD